MSGPGGQADRSAHGARASRDLLSQELDVARDRLDTTRSQLENVTLENERLVHELSTASAYVEAVSAEKDRLDSLRVIERASFESNLSVASQVADDARRELEALKQTRILRHTSELRRIYGLMRRMTQRGRTSRFANRCANSFGCDTAPRGASTPGAYADWIARFDTLDSGGTEELRSHRRRIGRPASHFCDLARVRPTRTPPSAGNWIRR